MSLKVLIIDDDKVVTMIHKIVTIKSGLSDTPICFLSAPDGLEYLNSSYNKNDRYLILLDINMPIMDGWQFLDSIQGQYPLIDVALVTSSIDVQDHDKARTYLQVIDYIEKPLTIESANHIKQLQRFPT